jgi:hypothetical protein
MPIINSTSSPVFPRFRLKLFPKFVCVHFVLLFSMRSETTVTVMRYFVAS